MIIIEITFIPAASGATYAMPTPRLAIDLKHLLV